MTDDVDITNSLSEHEVDLINYLRGFTEEGEPTPSKWSAMIERLPGGRWRVTHWPGAALLVGEGLNFDEAWASQSDPVFRENPPATLWPATAKPPLGKPRLTVIRGGRS